MRQNASRIPAIAKSSTQFTHVFAARPQATARNAHVPNALEARAQDCDVARIDAIGYPLDTCLAAIPVSTNS